MYMSNHSEGKKTQPTKQEKPTNKEKAAEPVPESYHPELKPQTG